MSVLIDTNIAIHLRDGNTKVRTRARDFVEVPSISLVELEGGVATKPALSARRRVLTDALLADLHVLNFDTRTADAYRDVMLACGYSRSRVLDRMIAATAIVHGLTLITMNGDDFRDIPGLALEVWPALGQ